MRLMPCSSCLSKIAFCLQIYRYRQVSRNDLDLRHSRFSTILKGPRLMNYCGATHLGRPSLHYTGGASISEVLRVNHTLPISEVEAPRVQWRRGRPYFYF